MPSSEEWLNCWANYFVRRLIEGKLIVWWEGTNRGSLLKKAVAWQDGVESNSFDDVCQGSVIWYVVWRSNMNDNRARCLQWHWLNILSFGQLQVVGQLVNSAYWMTWCVCFDTAVVVEVNWFPGLCPLAQNSSIVNDGEEYSDQSSDPSNYELPFVISQNDMTFALRQHPQTILLWKLHRANPILCDDLMPHACFYPETQSSMDSLLNWPSRWSVDRIQK